MTAQAPTATRNRSLTVNWFRDISLLTSVLALLFYLGSASPAPAADDPVENPFPLAKVFSFGPDGTEGTDFNRVGSIALDQQRELVYVLRATASEAILFKFASNGTPVDFTGANPDIEGNRIEGLDLVEGSSIPNKLAVDHTTGVIYVLQPESVLALDAEGEPADFTAGAGAGTSVIPGLGEVQSVATDSNGSIYVGSTGPNVVSIFAATGAPLTSFAAPANLRGIAVAPDGAVYVNRFTFDIRRFTPSSFPVSASTTYSGGATFIAPIDGALLPGLGADPVSGDLYVLETHFGVTTTSLRRYDAAGALVESFGVPGSPTQSQAFGGGSGHIAVWGEAKEVSDGEAVKLYLSDLEVTEPPLRSKVAALGRTVVAGPPELAKASALDVTADSARLRAWVNPNSAPTTYRFEYGLSDCALNPCTEIPIGGASIGDGNDPIAVSHPITHLEPDTTYHYRVLAENSEGSAPMEPDRTFTTQALGLGSELIDARVWEMVSPPDKHGAQLMGMTNGLIQAESGGDGLAYLSRGTIESDPEGYRGPEISSILARRGPLGWHSRDVSSANREILPAAGGITAELKFYSPDLARGIVSPRGNTPLSPQTSERTPYLRDNTDPPIFTPLVTGKEGFANVPPGTKFGGTENDTYGRIAAVGVTPDLSQVVLQSTVPLAEGHAISPPAEALYLWRSGQLGAISMLPAGEGGGLAAFAARLGSGKTSIQHAISTDGSRVFWSRDTALYLRDTLAEETVRLDAKEPGATGAGNAAPVFQGASADGTAVFFADTRDLTADASPGNGRDLYRCEIPAGSPASGCATLTSVSVPLAGSGESAQVLGMASGLSEDGTRIYFTAKGVLDEIPNQYGDIAVAGSPNLYRWHEGESVRFLATLDEKDRATWGAGGSSATEGVRLTAAVSPSGRYLSFSSQLGLTGQPNLDAESGEQAQQVFYYDALNHRLDCVSCNPFGSAPWAEDPGAQPFVSAEGQYSGLRAAATIPAAFGGDVGRRSSFYRPRSVLDNGRVFFNSFDALVPADSNSQWDVYQWEPDGLGGCGVSSGDAATIRSAGGCLSLLSSGTAEREAGFFDASATGDDVFFITSARLSAVDIDSELDVYDARVNGIPAVLTPSAECLGEACQPAAAPPARLDPASAAFRGAGNPLPETRPRCPKGKRLVRRNGNARCIPRKKKHRGQGRKHRHSAAKSGRTSR